MQGVILTANTAAKKLTISRLDVNFQDLTQNIDRVSGA